MTIRPGLPPDLRRPSAFGGMFANFDDGRGVGVDNDDDNDDEVVGGSRPGLARCRQMPARGVKCFLAIEVGDCRGGTVV